MRNRLVFLLSGSLCVVALIAFALIANYLDSFFFIDAVRADGGISALGIIGAAAANVVGGLVSDYINMSAQADTNAANERIARENREWQSGENVLSRDWQEKMWNLQNQYNTPSAQAQRLREGGFNPYLVGSELTSGTAGSAGSPSMQSAPNQPNLQAPHVGATSEAIGRTGDMILQAQQVNANVANQSSQAERNYSEVGKEIYKLYGEEAAQKYLSSRIKETHGASADGSYYMRKWRADAESSELQASFQSMYNEVYKKYGARAADAAIAVQEQTYNKMASEIGLMASQGRVNDSIIRTNTSQYIRNIADAYKLKREGDKYFVDAQTAQMIQSSYVKMISAQANIMSMNNETLRAFFNSHSSIRDALNRGEFNMKFLEAFESTNDPDLKILGAWLGAFGQMFNSSFNVGTSSSTVHKE